MRKLSTRERANCCLRAGDLVITKSSGSELHIGKTSIVDDAIEAMESCYSNFMQRLRCRKELIPRFLFYVLNSPIGRDQFVYGSNSTTGLANLTGTMIGNLRLPVPLSDEQKTIVAFLDRETAKIDNLVADKIRLIRRLEEKRNVLIRHATAYGLDSSVSYSRVESEWLNQIPSHWRLMPLKLTARRGYKTFTDGDWIEAPFITDAGVRLIQTGNIGIGHYREQGHRYVSEETFAALRCTEVRPGDVLICRLDGPVGRACVVPKLAERMITSVDNTILRPSSDNDSRFLVYLLSSSEWLGWIASLCRVGGGFRLRVSRTMLGNFRVPVPPKAEQSHIADVLDDETTKITQLVIQVERGIQKLMDYRSALISAAVTGQIDVRNCRPEALCP